MQHIGIFNIIHLLMVLLILYVVIDFAIRYAKATSSRTGLGAFWDKLVIAGHDSATILWQRFVYVVSALTATLVSLSDWLSLPGVSEAIRTILANPVYVALFFIFSAVISECARRRTLAR